MLPAWENRQLLRRTASGLGLWLCCAPEGQVPLGACPQLVGDDVGEETQPTPEGTSAGLWVT